MVTPHEQVKWNESTAPIAAFGENMVYHPAANVMVDADEVQFALAGGMFLGMLRRSSEYIEGTSRGVIGPRSINIMSERECWDVRLSSRFPFIPCKPMPGR